MSVLPLNVRAALASVATALFLLLLKSYAAWATGSVAMLGSLADTGLDLVASLATLYGVHLASTPADIHHRFGHGKAEAIAALILDQYLGFAGADPLFGVGIAGWLLWGAWRASAVATDQLMDKEWPEEKRREFLRVASQHPELKGIHDLRTRTSGAHDFVQFHVWVAPDMTVAHAHQVMDEIEDKLRAAFPGTEILIHPDPEGHTDQDALPTESLAKEKI
jgi:divalent metal cation (Fe/Co/Zn/Cd) transporter